PQPVAAPAAAAAHLDGDDRLRRVPRRAGGEPQRQAVGAAAEPQIGPAAIGQAAAAAERGEAAVAPAPPAAARAEPAEQPPMPRIGRLRRVVGKPLQLRRADAQGRVAEMEEAELEAALVAAVGAQLRRHGEGNAAGLGRELGGGEVAPGELEPAQYENLDPQRRLRGMMRRRRPRGDMQPVGAGLQVPVGAVEEAARRRPARHGRGAVRPPRHDRAAFEAGEKLPAAGRTVPFAGRLFGDRRGVNGHGHGIPGNGAAGQPQPLVVAASRCGRVRHAAAGERSRHPRLVPRLPRAHDRLSGGADRPRRAVRPDGPRLGDLGVFRHRARRMARPRARARAGRRVPDRQPAGAAPRRPARRRMTAAAATLVDILGRHVAERPDARACVMLADRGGEEASLTFAELDRRARALAARIAAQAGPGERALLLFPTGIEFPVAFCACLFAGVVAVPVMPPRRQATRDASAAIVADCTPRLALTSAALLAGRGDLPERVGGGLAWLTVEDAAPAEFAGAAPGPDDIAFLQYTSGSTSAPKGVVVSHANLAANLAMIAAAFGNTARSTHASWLPLYHDMGLIMNLLQALYLGATAVLMSPVAFLQRPLAWLRAIAEYRAEVAGAPNFAYDLCVARYRAEAMAGVDLSGWRVAFNGAEPVRAETLRRFAETFAPHGFSAAALRPAYGMAEATVLISAAAAGGAKTRRVEEREVV